MLRGLLLPFSWIFGGITLLRNFLYTRGFFSVYQSQLPIIAVGNLSTGGTGKTPMTEYLLRYGKRYGVNVAYLSRGYGRKSSGVQFVGTHANAIECGDEAVQIANKFPEALVMVAEHRKAGIKRLHAETDAQWIVLDDAFQHRKVDRHLNFVLIDARRLPHRDFMLPTGNLREPIYGLKRADAIIFTRIADTVQIPHLRKQYSKWNKPLLFSNMQSSYVHHFHAPFQPIPLTELSNRSVILFSGIGNTDSFYQQVERTGANILDHFRFGDHHTYTQQDIHRLIQRLQQVESSSSPWLLTTEKDFYRLKGSELGEQLCDYPCYFLSIEIAWLAGEEILDQLLRPLLPE